MTLISGSFLCVLAHVGGSESPGCPGGEHIAGPFPRGSSESQVHGNILVGVEARVLHPLQTEPLSQLGTGDQGRQ